VLPDGRIQIANRTFAGILGYHREDLAGKAWKELMPPDEGAPPGELFEPLLSSPVEQPTVRTSTRCVRRDGSSVWLDLAIVLLKDANANPLHFVVTAVDITGRREAEAKLAESEARYRALFENMNGGFVLFEVVQDDNGAPVDLTILAGNKGFETATGLSLAEVTGRRFTEVLPGIERDSADWIGTYGRVAFTGEPCHFEKGSDLLGHRYSVNAYRPAPNQCAVTFLDVTEARQAETERDLLFEAISLSLNEVYLFDAETWRFRFVSQGAQRNLGYSMEQLREMTPLDLKPEFDTESFTRMVAPLLAGEKAYQEFETVHRRADASLYPVEVRLQLLEHEGERVFLALILDLTQRHRAEAERARLIQTIEQTADTILVTSPEGVIQYVNPAFEAATGYTREEVLGRNPRLLKSGLHDKAFYRDLWGTITSGRTWKGRFLNRRKDGTLCTEDTTISPVLDQNGRIVNYLAVQRDITQQLEAAEEKSRLEEQLHRAQRLESVGRLAGGIAHDFNNMLGVILGYGESILEQLREGDPLREEVEEIIGAGQRSSALTRQLLAFSRRQTLQPEVIDLNSVIRNMEKLLGRLIGEDIRLQLVLSENLHPVLADPSQMEQVIMNLAVN
jgi:PAS domain S-box-containing protein